MVLDLTQKTANTIQSISVVADDSGTMEPPWMVRVEGKEWPRRSLAGFWSPSSQLVAQCAARTVPAPSGPAPETLEMSMD